MTSKNDSIADSSDKETSFKRIGQENVNFGFSKKDDEFKNNFIQEEENSSMNKDNSNQKNEQVNQIASKNKMAQTIDLKELNKNQQQLKNISQQNKHHTQVSSSQQSEGSPNLLIKKPNLNQLKSEINVSQKSLEENLNNEEGEYLSNIESQQPIENNEQTEKFGPFIFFSNLKKRVINNLTRHQFQIIGDKASDFQQCTHNKDIINEH